MERFTINANWLRPLMPEGILVPSSTLISGPGGSGKPLIAGLFLASWLKQNGALVHLLINSDRRYAENILTNYGIRTADYQGRIVYIDFDPQLNGIKKENADLYTANLLKPEIWQQAFHTAKRQLSAEKRPLLLFGAALNILFFSPTYGEAIYQTVLKTVQGKEHCLFTISNTIFEEKMARLEQAADNLFFTHSEKIMELHLNIARLRQLKFSGEDIRVPLREEELYSMRSEAEKMRKHLIPLLRKI